MPNQPQATSARRREGRCAPLMPKAARASTGKGKPYFAPIQPDNDMGINRMTLAMRIVRMPCHQSMPRDTCALAR
eukprot:scaffold80_cov382-Prasinococcus_capsulatus_cf.AAC.19